MWPPKNNYASHEWWSADGKTIYYCSDNYGIYGINIETGEDITILEGIDPWHAYSSKDDSLFIWDEKKLERYGGKWYRGCPSALNFFNRTTGKNLVVISEMPENGHTPENQNPYHIDPHPRFTENEKYAIFTTTELGGVDLGVVVVEELLELTK
jgi:Tol biopolymer transport system component